MNINILKAIATKDLLEVRQNKAAWMPMVIVPLVFVLLLPLGLVLVPQLLDVPVDQYLADPDLETFFENINVHAAPPYASGRHSTATRSKYLPMKHAAVSGKPEGRSNLSDGKPAQG